MNYYDYMKIKSVCKDKNLMQNYEISYDLFSNGDDNYFHSRRVTYKYIFNSFNFSFFSSFLILIYF